MSDPIKKGLIARGIDKIASTSFFGDPEKRKKEATARGMSNTNIMNEKRQGVNSIIKEAQKRQTPNSAYTGSGSANNVGQTKKLPSAQKSNSGYEMKGTGSKETHSESTFSSSQQSKALRGFGDLTSGLKSQISEGVSKINAQTKRNELSKGISDFAAAASKQTSKPSKKETRLSNKISRTESRQASRLDRVMRRESQGKDATVTRQKLQSGARRLGRLKNKK